MILIRAKEPVFGKIKQLRKLKEALSVLRRLKKPCRTVLYSSNHYFQVGVMVIEEMNNKEQR